MCSDPYQEERTTYTECCCLHGVAWSGQCAFCPRRDSSEEAETLKTLPYSLKRIFNVSNASFITVKLCLQRTLPQCATCRGSGTRTICVSSQDMSTLWRGQMTTWTPLSPHTLTLTATLQDLMTSLRAFLSSLTMTTACSCRPPVSPSYDHGNTRRTAWIITPVGLHVAS